MLDRDFPPNFANIDFSHIIYLAVVIEFQHARNFKMGQSSTSLANQTFIEKDHTRSP